MSSFTIDPKKMNREEEEIYNILYKKKEINDKTPNLRTEDEKKKLKNLSYKIRKFPKNLIDNNFVILIFTISSLKNVVSIAMKYRHQ